MASLLLLLEALVRCSDIDLLLSREGEACCSDENVNQNRGKSFSGGRPRFVAQGTESSIEHFQQWEISTVSVWP